MTTTFRQARRIGYFDSIEAFKADYDATAAGNDKLNQIYRARPASFKPPTIFVGSFRETIIHTMGVRTRQARDQIVLLQGVYDNAETADRQDKLVDAFMDWLTEHYDPAGTNTVTEAVEAEDAEIDIKGIVYFGTIFTITSDIGEGRN